MYYFKEHENHNLREQEYSVEKGKGEICCAINTKFLRWADDTVSQINTLLNVLNCHSTHSNHKTSRTYQKWQNSHMSYV